MSLTPINDNVLLELEEEKQEKTSGGIIIPDSAAEKPIYAKVVAVGNDSSDSIKAGDLVLYKKFSGTEMEYEDKKYILIPYSDILAKVVETEEI